MTTVQITKDEMLAALREAVADILKTGNSAQKLYLRIRPSGEVNVDEQASWCCSPDEYYRQVPHTLSLELLKSTRDYSDISEADIEECAEAAPAAADELVAGWMGEIEAWIEAGNFAA
jgi:hypothetical protein